MVTLILAAGFGLAGVAAPVWAADSDGDGVDNAMDVCSNTPAGTAVDAKGRPLGDVDRDCDTDLDDFALLQQGMTGSLPPPPGMVFIPGGEFAMGCHAETGESCESEELPVHDVYVDPFYMDVHEVTNQQYCEYLNSTYGQGLIEVTSGVVYKAGDSKAYCDTTTSSSYSRITWNGSTFGITAGKENHPMVMVSWYGAVAFANWLSEQDGRTPSYDPSTWQCDFDANGYRLPTEAEWEYAARGGEHDPYYAYPWGNAIDGSKANYSDSGDPYEGGGYPWTTPAGYYDGSQTPLGTDMANGYGLYDMAGNAWEWCHDWWDGAYYGSSPYDNPQGPANGTFRVSRGGAWYEVDVWLRCAFRRGFAAYARDAISGFRVAAGT
jgi:formylglycine-generating enzyme required for sulfatase activity